MCLQECYTGHIVECYILYWSAQTCSCRPAQRVSFALCSSHPLLSSHSYRYGPWSPVQWENFNKKKKKKVTYNRGQKSERQEFMRVVLVRFITGTAAISVGFRTVASPLLPFLILVDCEEKINTNTSKQNRKCLKQQQFLGVLNIHIFSMKVDCFGTACFCTHTLSPLF